MYDVSCSVHETHFVFSYSSSTHGRCFTDTVLTVDTCYIVKAQLQPSASLLFFFPLIHVASIHFDAAMHSPAQTAIVKKQLYDFLPKNKQTAFIVFLFLRLPDASSHTERAFFFVLWVCSSCQLNLLFLIPAL